MAKNKYLVEFWYEDELRDKVVVTAGSELAALILAKDKCESYAYEWIITPEVRKVRPAIQDGSFHISIRLAPESEKQDEAAQAEDVDEPVQRDSTGPEDS